MSTQKEVKASGLLYVWHVDSKFEGTSKVIDGGVVKFVPRVIGGGVLELERVQVICPACGQQVEAVAADGRVKGYCAVAKQYVDFSVDTQLPPQSVVTSAETRAKLSASAKKLWQDPEYQAKQIATHTGRHPSPETKAKMSAAFARRHASPGQ